MSTHVLIAPLGNYCQTDQVVEVAWAAFLVRSISLVSSLER